MAVWLRETVILFPSQLSIGEDILRMTTDDIISRTRLLDNDIKVTLTSPVSGHVTCHTLSGDEK